MKKDMNGHLLNLIENSLAIKEKLIFFWQCYNAGLEDMDEWGADSELQSFSTHFWEILNHYSKLSQEEKDSIVNVAFCNVYKHGGPDATSTDFRSDPRRIRRPECLRFHKHKNIYTFPQLSNNNPTNRAVPNNQRLHSAGQRPFIRNITRKECLEFHKYHGDIPANMLTPSGEIKNRKNSTT